MPNVRLAILLLSIVAFQGCTPSQPEIVRPTGGTTYPPTQFVDLLETAPTRSYVEIGTIDAPGEPGALRTQVLAQIRSRAQQIGADAVILQDLSRTAPATPRLNPSTGQYDNTPGQVIPAFKGIAIRYR
jgi:hypothetical protein